MFLHIFRDSPFEYIDPDRIYAGYVDWVLDTLKTIAFSGEDWLVKFHPAAARWGENQANWLSSIVRDAFGAAGLPSNVQVSENEFSNIDLFTHASRVVTFSGTAHLEAACFGVRPIVISHTTLASFGSGLVLKPRTRADYRHMLLSRSSTDLFVLSPNEQSLSRQVLFVRDNILGFAEEGLQFIVYRGDSAEEVRALLKTANAQLAGRGHRFSEIGAALEKGLGRTVGFDYFFRWEKHLLPSYRTDS